MAHSTINASETDADSPLNQTLMDKIRTNDDDHETRVLALEGKGSLTVQGTQSRPTTGSPIPRDFTLNSAVDWRGRPITISGIIAAAGATGAAESDVDVIVSSGSEADEVFFQNGAAGWAAGSPTIGGTYKEYDWIDGFIWPVSGSAAYNTKPYLVYAGILGSSKITDVYIWVDSSTGYLMASWAQNGDADISDFTMWAAWNLQLVYGAKIL